MEYFNDQLSRIVIKGYKSIKNCDLQLNNINVLIGSNGAGKSNFISVFLLLQFLLNQKLALYAGQKGVHSLFHNGTKETESIFFEFFFNLNSYAIELELSEDNRLIFRSEKFGYGGQWSSPLTASIGQSESMWHSGSNNPNYNNYVIPVLKRLQWRIYHFHDTSQNSTMKKPSNLSNSKFLLQDAANLAAFLHRLKNYHATEYKNILETIQLIAPYFKDFELEPSYANQELITLHWLQKGCDDVFNASQLSDGTLRFICLATLLLQPVELQPATIIIDEPELGLHPYAITIFAELVKKIAVSKQVILSTQSVELLNHFDTQDVIVVDSDENGSKFERLNPTQLATWLEDDYSLGELWNKNIFGGRLTR